MRIEAPVIDTLVIREITDNTQDVSLRGENYPGLSVQRTGSPQAAQGNTLESEWGLALEPPRVCRRLHT